MTEEGPAELLRGFELVGSVQSVRQEYQVFSTPRGDYLVFSTSSRSPSSYHVTHVSAPRVDAIKGCLGKSGVTTKSLMKEKKIRDAFKSVDDAGLRFDLLMALYVLAAQGVVEMGKEGRNLTFTSSIESIHPGVTERG